MNTNAIAILDYDPRTNIKRIKIFIQQDQYQIIGVWDTSMHNNKPAVYTNPQAGGFGGFKDDATRSAAEALMLEKLVIAKQKLKIQEKEKGLWIE